MAVASAVIPESGELIMPVERIEELQGEVDRLRSELLRVRTRAGDLKPPDAINDKDSARIWLEWAGRHHHSDGCSCRRCPQARRLLGRGGR